MDIDRVQDGVLHDEKGDATGQERYRHQNLYGKKPRRCLPSQFTSR